MANVEPQINWSSPKNTDKDAAIYGDEEFVEEAATESLGEEQEPGSQSDTRATVLTPRVKELRKLARESKLAPSQRMPFLAAAELDEMRKTHERVGVAKLFEACCEHGTVHWLNPIAELRGITDNLGNFQGSPKVMRQFMFLLLELARAGVPPAAFVRYVMMPRMGLDADWRRWRERHFWALQRIGELLISMRNKRPFHEEFLPNSRTLTEVVLVKYVGKPLARFSVGVLEDDSLLEQYKEAWQSLGLHHPVFILFLRLNVFPFLYRLSGKVDLVQLIPIVQAAGELEPEFAASFSDEDLQKAEDLFSVSLYTDFEANMQARADKGLTVFSLVREIRAYLAIIRSLIRTNAGIYLSGYFASLLRSVLDPDCAEGLAELVPAVTDTGGMDALRRHARRFTLIEEELRRQYIYDIHHNGGLHPEYEPREITRLFQSPELPANAERRTRLGNSLGIQAPQTPPAADHICAGFDPLLSSYMQVHPEHSGIIEDFRSEFSQGKDAAWKLATYQRMDELGDAARELCLYATIPGLVHGRGAERVTAFSMNELYQRYGAAGEQQALRAQLEFVLPLQHPVEVFPEYLNMATNAALRKKVEFGPLTQIFEEIIGTDSGTQTDISPRQVLPVLNQRARALDDAVRKYRDAELQGNTAVARPLQALSAQRAQLETVFGVWEDLSEEQRFLLSVFVAARIAKPGDQLSSTMLRLVLARYGVREDIAARAEYLRSDVAPQRPTLRQLALLLNYIDSIRVELRLHARELFPLTAEFAEVVAPFNLHGGRLGTHALDAALRRVFQYGRLETESARLVDLQNSLREPGAAARSTANRTMLLRASKSCMDAFYGEMGAPLYSGSPDAILRPGFQVLRLVDSEQRRVVGVAYVAFSSGGIESLGVQRFYYAFGFHLMDCISRNIGRSGMMKVYLQFRRMLESLASKSGLPVFLPGSSAVVSDSEALAEVILLYEKKQKPRQAADALKLDLQFSARAFARGYLIIDPASRAGFNADAALKQLSPG